MTDLRTAQHQRVVMGLVTVPVDQHYVTRADDRLDNDLVRRRGPVGDGVGLVCTECSRSQLLCPLDRAGRVEQESRPPEVADVSVRNMSSPYKSLIWWIQGELTTDFPARSAAPWNTPVGWRL